LNDGKKEIEAEITVKRRGKFEGVNKGGWGGKEKQGGYQAEEHSKAAPERSARRL